MSGKGNCYDNAIVNVFKTLKCKLVSAHRLLHPPQEADQAITRGIDGFYNPVQHPALDFTSPAQFKKTTAK